MVRYHPNIFLLNIKQLTILYSQEILSLALLDVKSGNWENSWSGFIQG